MAITVFDSRLYSDMFGCPEMRAIFADEALVRHYLEVEAALARAEARLGIVPLDAAAAIDRAVQDITVDYVRLRQETENVGYPILAIVHQLAEAAGEAGRYVHWGATTQDIMDTASVLQIRSALDVVEQGLQRIAAVLARLAAEHRDTPMPGRTHLQHALPVTFGYKCAVWLAGIDRHLERLSQLRPRVLVGQFAGAAGTLASIGARGLEVQEAFCDELGLGVPVATWHVARDGIAEAVCLLGLVTGTLGKIAMDVILMSSTEFGELAEPFVAGRGASSTMPQKRNAISSELMLAGSKIVRQNVALMLDAMVQDLERATGPWHLEWALLPETFAMTGGALKQAAFMLEGLEVFPDRMRANLDITQGLIVAEAVMMRAAPALGRQRAHDVVYDACREAIESGSGLEQILLANREIVDAIGGEEAVRAACAPVNYVGLSGPMVDRVLKQRAAV